MVCYSHIQCSYSRPFQHNIHIVPSINKWFGLLPINIPIDLPNKYDLWYDLTMELDELTPSPPTPHSAVVQLKLQAKVCTYAMRRWVWHTHIRLYSHFNYPCYAWLAIHPVPQVFAPWMTHSCLNHS